MNLPNTRLLAYNVFAMIKLLALIVLSLGGFVLMVSEPIDNNGSLYTLLLSKIVGMGALYIAYQIFNGSLNKLNE